MTDVEFVQVVVEASRGVNGASAVALGGSRAHGDNPPDSDWDYAAGALARVAHGRLAHNGVWALNQKRMLEGASLMDLAPTFAPLGTTRAALDPAVDRVDTVRRTVEQETAV